MTDAEAEAVLLALGGALQWTAYQVDRGGKSAIYETAYVDEGDIVFYNVLPQAAWWWLAWLVGPTQYVASVKYKGQEAHEHCPRRFKTPDAAREACQHHRLTRKWEDANG